MKKWILALIILLIVGLACTYIFIPSTLSISAVRVLQCTPNGSFRTIAEKNKWQQWFPQSMDTADYTITSTLVNTVYITIRHNGDTTNSIMHLLPFSTDSTAIQWQCQVSTGNNPFTRIQRYQKAVAIKKDMDNILNSFRAFVAKPENVYGFKIERTSYTDSLLLATKTNTSEYPSTSEIYQKVNALKAQIAQQQAAITGYPMVNVSRLDSSHYQFMVAIPVDRVLADRKLPDGQVYSFRRMVPGAFMMTEVRGGQSAVKEALLQMQTYFYDHRKTAMAIPFEVHITDRLVEPDSSKWTTRIYAPVF